MKGSNREPDRTQRARVRLAVLISFGGGLAAGIVGLTGYQDGFSPMLYTLAGASLVILGVAFFLAHRTLPKADASPPLPGDIYGDREAPEPHSVDPGSLNGRVPFSESKNVAKAAQDPEKAELYNRLESLNKQLQRANVKLGLGELSREGYTKIVEELKERRAEVEAKINTVAMQEEGMRR